MARVRYMEGIFLKTYFLNLVVIVELKSTIIIFFKIGELTILSGQEIQKTIQSTYGAQQAI